LRIRELKDSFPAYHIVIIRCDV